MNGKRKSFVFGLTAIAIASISVHAEWVIDTIPTGTNPRAISVNPVTNMTYVANFGSNTVSVINGAISSVTATIVVDSNPCAVAVNPLSNKIYVANKASNTVTVIDGATNLTTRVAVGISPSAIAINGTTDQIYVANFGSNTVTRITGATNDTLSIPVGNSPNAVAVNPVTNKVFVADSGSNTVTVIDGATNNTTVVAVGTGPRAVAVNTVTNTVYVANSGSMNVTVINGDFNSVIATVAADTTPYAVVVNQVTNKIYVANYGARNVSIIDGTTNTIIINRGVGIQPCAIAVNPTTNRIYVANNGSTVVSAIDGATNGRTSISIQSGSLPIAIAVNTITNKIFIANDGTGNITVIEGAVLYSTTVPTVSSQLDVAVNPVTNKIYFANYNNLGYITVVDGNTNGVDTTIAIDSLPYRIAVNPLTNKIYVTCQSDSVLKIINGTTYAIKRVALRNGIVAIAINPATNRIYVGGNDIWLLDGTTDSAVHIAGNVGLICNAAVNPVTNKIYMSDRIGDEVYVIDGASNHITSIRVGNGANGIAVNTLTNMIYAVSIYDSNRVAVINGTTNVVTAFLPLPAQSYEIAVNNVTNKIYIANFSSDDLTIIDGVTNARTIIPVNYMPEGIAVNTVTNKIYLSSYNAVITTVDGATNKVTSFNIACGSSRVAVNPLTNRAYFGNDAATITVIDETPVSDIYLHAVIDTLPNHTTFSARPVLTGKAVSRQRPGHTGVSAVLQFVNTAQYPWDSAIITNNSGTDSVSWSWNWGSDSLPWGESFLCFAALDSHCTATNNLGFGTPFTGDVSVYPIYRIMQLPSSPDKPVLVSPSDNAIDQPTTLTFSWNRVSGATSYNIQVSSDSLFSSLRSDEGGIVDTFKMVLGLSRSTVYFWRVCSFNLGGFSEWSSVWRITTIIAAPTRPTLVSPANGDINLPITLSLVWRSSLRASSYHIQVATDSSFTTLFTQDSTLTDTMKQITGLAQNTVYYWRVRAKNIGGVSSWSWVLNFTTIIPSPNTPMLLSPANGALDQPVSISLVWNSDSLASSHHVQVALDPGFTTLFTVDSTLTDTIKSLNGLARNTIYYWRVRAKNISGVSNWSSYWDFTTSNVAVPQAPILVSPANGAIDKPDPLTLTWENVNTAVSYHVQVALDTGFTNIVEQDSLIIDSLVSMFALANSTVHYWRVRAKNAGGVSSWSAVWHFTTSIAAPATPLLVAPDNGAVNQPVSLSIIWNRRSTATSYHIQLATDTGFTTIVIKDSILTDTVTTVSSLTNSTIYYWRVRAKNTGGVSEWATYRRFTTIVALPSAVLVLTPVDSAIIVVDSVRLLWNRASPAIDRYLVEVATDSAMTTLIMQDSTVADTTQLVTSLVNNTTYYWRVKAHNVAGWGGYSAETRFVTSFTGVLYRGTGLRAFSLKYTSGMLRYTLPNRCYVSVKYYDIRGRMVGSFVNSTEGAGAHSLSLPLSSWAVGAYIQVFTAGEIVRKDRIMVVK